MPYLARLDLNSGPEDRPRTPESESPGALVPLKSRMLRGKRLNVTRQTSLKEKTLVLTLDLNPSYAKLLFLQLPPGGDPIEPRHPGAH